MRRRAVSGALGLLAILALATGAQAANEPPPTAPPPALVVALGLRDPALAAGVVRGSDVVLARGFEVELARLLARRLGGRIDRFVALRPAVRLLAGAPGGWHLAVGGIEPSRAVRAVADPSDPYLTTDAAVVLRRHLSRPRGIADLRGRVVCALRGSDSARLVGTVVRPKTAPLLAPGDDRLRELLRTGACDAALVPAIEAGRFVRGHGRELGPVAGRIASGNGLVFAVARGTGLPISAVNGALGRLRSEGTLGRLARSWLGLDPARLRTLR